MSLGWWSDITEFTLIQKPDKKVTTGLIKALFPQETSGA